MGSNTAIFIEEVAEVTLKRIISYGAIKFEYKFSKASSFSLFPSSAHFLLQTTPGEQLKILESGEERGATDTDETFGKTESMVQCNQTNKYLEL